LRVSSKTLWRSGADYLVLHTDLRTEILGYWRFVHEEAWPRVQDPALASLMRTFEKPSLVIGRDARLQAVLRELHERLGQPVHVDPYVKVWKLR
jgi:hypothetical protein